MSNHINPNDALPEHGQFVFFKATYEKVVRIGKFNSPNKYADEAYMGSFIDTEGIGYKCWRNTTVEVEWWEPIKFPEL